MTRLTMFVPWGLFGVCAVVIGLSGPASGQVGKPPKGGPLEDIQIQLGNIQNDIGNLQDTVDEIAPNLPKPQGPCEIPPVWGKKWPDDERFVQALDGGAYCDRETGLVWDGAPNIGLVDWNLAFFQCLTRTVDGRKGWRLPLVEQLTSLVDRSSATSLTCDGPCLPAGHPFKSIQQAIYWTATSSSTSNTGIGPQKYNVDFNIGTPGGASRDDISYVWCVRGGQSFDGEDAKEVFDALP